jgi:hypothetical protein
MTSITFLERRCGQYFSDGHPKHTFFQEANDLITKRGVRSTKQLLKQFNSLTAKERYVASFLFLVTTYRQASATMIRQLSSRDRDLADLASAFLISAGDDATARKLLRCLSGRMNDEWLIHILDPLALMWNLSVAMRSKCIVTLLDWLTIGKPTRVREFIAHRLPDALGKINKSSEVYGLSINRLGDILDEDPCSNVVGEAIRSIGCLKAACLLPKIRTLAATDFRTCSLAVCPETVETISTIALDVIAGFEGEKRQKNKGKKGKSENKDVPMKVNPLWP